MSTVDSRQVAMANHVSISSSGAPLPSLPTDSTGQMPVPPPTTSPSITSSQNTSACSLNRKQSIWLSAVLIASGVLGFIGTAMGLYSLANLAETGAGIWCGLVFVSTGYVAIVAGHYRTIRLMKATVATAVFSVVFAVILVVISSIGLFSESKCRRQCSDLYKYCHCDNLERMGTISNGILLASGTTAIIFAIWLFIISRRSEPKMSKIPKVANHNKELPSDTTSAMPSLPLQQTLASSPHSQPIIIFSTHIQPTVLFGQDPTTLPQVQPVVIVGQQTQPIVVPDNQSQPTVVLIQDPQKGVAVNIQTQPVVHPTESQSLSSKNPAENLEASHGGKEDFVHRDLSDITVVNREDQS